MKDRFRGFLVKILSKLANAEVRQDHVVISKKLLFIEPDLTLDKYEASNTLEDFINKIENK